MAIKYLQRGRSIDKHVSRELKSHISFCHPHVVRFRHLFLTKTHLAIVFEYAEGGDLYCYVSCAPRSSYCWISCCGHECVSALWLISIPELALMPCADRRALCLRMRRGGSSSSW